MWLFIITCVVSSLCGVVSSLCLVVTSLCLVVTSLCFVVTSLCLVVSSLRGLFIAWCGFVFMFCWLHFRYKALVPRSYSLLGTSQTGFKRRPISCSSTLSKITRWWEQATTTFRLACEGRKHHEEYSEGPQTRVSYSEICCQKNWGSKCIGVVRWRACTSWCNYDRRNRHRLRALCANTEKTIKLIQRPIKSLYLTPGSKLMVPRSIPTSPNLKWRKF